MDKELTNYLDEQFNIANLALIEALAKHNENVSRRLGLAESQLSEACTIEEFQQIGIIVRDAWIEFTQSLYCTDMVTNGVNKPRSDDVRTMLKYTLRYVNVRQNNEYLLKIAIDTYNLALKVQHDLNVTKQMCRQCLTVTSLCMGLVLDSIASNEIMLKRPYYKCPNCGSIELKIIEEWVPDIEGAFEVDKLTCIKCNWYYIEDMGGISGVG